jgi:hypothetical protein
MLSTILATLALVVALIRPTPVDWTKVYEETWPAVVPLYEVHDGHWDVMCSLVTVSVDPPILFGEEHCFNYPAHGRLAGPSTYQVLGVWNELVAILLNESWEGMQALPIMEGFPKKGEQVAVIGYGLLTRNPQFTVGRVMAPVDSAMDTFLSEARYSLPFIYTDILQLPGHSGGAIITKDGELVSLVKANIEVNESRPFAKSLSPSLLRAFYETMLMQ